MKEPVRAVLTALLAAAAAAIVPPLAMTLAWALLSGNPRAFFADIGTSGMAGFVASQQRFFAPVVAAGLGAHAVLYRLRRVHPLLYVGVFYVIGIAVYAASAAPQMAAFTLDAAVARTLIVDAVAWWAPLAGLGGLVFWSIAGRHLHLHLRRRRRP